MALRGTLKKSSESELAAQIRSAIGAAHLAGIEGGIEGAVADMLAGAGIDEAAGLGDSWSLPEGISRAEVEAEVRRQLREAAAPQ